MNGCKNTSLHMAAEKGHLDKCKLVCQEIGNENPEDNFNKTPLYQKPSGKWLVS